MTSISTAESLALKAKLFRGFSDPSRLSILEALRPGPRSVSEVVELTSLGQSNVSNHLACLLDCGLVAREQRGRFVYYVLSDARVMALLQTGDEILLDVTDGFYTCPRYELDSDGAEG